MAPSPKAELTWTFEHAYYIGNYMSGILYGVDLVFYFMTMKGILKNKSSNSTQKRSFYAVYSTILLVLLTIDISTNSVWGEVMWINARDTPGGVTEFIDTHTNVWYQTLSSTSVVAMIFIGDALLLYRLFILYRSNYLVILFSLLAYLSAFALAIIELVLAGKPNGDFFHGKPIKFGTPYYAATIALNIVVTLLIVVRLSKLGRAVSKALGKENAKIFTGVAAILVESAAPYSAVGIMFLIPYGMGNSIAIAFGQVWAKLTCLAPQLIVLRVVTGRAWGREVVIEAESLPSDIRFSSGHSTGFELRSQGTILGGAHIASTSECQSDKKRTVE